MLQQIVVFAFFLLFFGAAPPYGRVGLFRSSLFARPCSACSALVWPNGHCCPSLSRGAARLGGGFAAPYWTENRQSEKLSRNRNRKHPKCQLKLWKAAILP